MDYEIIIDLVAGFFDLCRKWKWTILVTLIAVLVIAGVYYQISREEDACRAKGGVPIQQSGHGTVCVGKVIDG